MKRKEERQKQSVIYRKPCNLEDICEVDLNCQVYLTTEGNEFRKQDGIQSKSKFPNPKQGKRSIMSSHNIDDINDKITRIISEISLTCKANDHSVQKRKQKSPKLSQSQINKTKKKQGEKRVSFQVLGESKRNSFQNERVSSFEQSGQSSLTSSQVDQRIKRINDKITIYQSKIRGQNTSINFSKNKENHHPIQIVPNQCCSVAPQKKHNQNKSRNQQAQLKQNCRRISTQKSESSLRIVSQNSSVVKNYSHFAKCLKKQIDLDHNLRQAKHLYAGLSDLLSDQHQGKRHEKWIQLSEQLQFQGMNLSLQEVVQIFAPREDQIDPFLSVSHSHEQLSHSLIFAFQESEQYWWSVMHQKWSLSDLREVGLNRENVDRQGKGWVSVGDLTSFADGLLDGDYRNRDLMLLYRRLGKGGELTFKEIYMQLLRV